MVSEEPGGAAGMSGEEKHKNRTMTNPKITHSPYDNSVS